MREVFPRPLNWAAPAVWAAAALVQALVPDAVPGVPARPGDPAAAGAGVLVGVEVLVAAVAAGLALRGGRRRGDPARTAAGGPASAPGAGAGGAVLTVAGAVLLAWTLLTGKLAVLDPQLWPSPGRVLGVILADREELGRGMAASLRRLALGYGLGLGVAIPLGLLVGWHRPLFQVVNPVTKFVAPIPPNVYIPYALVLFPDLESAGVFIVFLGVFWPVFANTVAGVHGVDRRYVEAARTLGASERTILWRCVLPAALPSIFAGVLVGTMLGFIMLTVAETIGASSGLGYYLLYYKDIAAYDRVVADILVIGAWVFAWTYLTDRIQRRALRWMPGGEGP